MLSRRRPILVANGAWRTMAETDVESVGRDVTKFKSGDEVFGDISGCGWGGFAEYVCARESYLALKSSNLSFPAAAAIPQAAILALQGLRDQGRLQKGQKVLINGAGGAVGTFAVQIAKASGAEVTGVDLPGKLEQLRTLGCDTAQGFFISRPLVQDLVSAWMNDHEPRRAKEPAGLRRVV